MELRERRQLLTTVGNPAPRLDYVVVLSGRLPSPESDSVILRYVPDRLVLPPEAFRRYLAALASLGETLEALAAMILDDMLNELVPRWVEVLVRRDGEPAHEILLVDRQPGWDNAPLLQRLKGH